MNDGPPTSPDDPPGPLRDLREAIRAELGMCPSFFRLAAADPQVARGVVDLARITYLESPLPIVFREKLFVYLSRFCLARYCVARYAAFLIGRRPSPEERPVSVEEVIALLNEPVPALEELPAMLAELEAHPAPLPDWPDFDARAGWLLRVACARLILAPERSAAWCHALRRLLGPRRYEQLVFFLTFARTAHFWTEVHPELQHDEDVLALLAEQEALARAVRDGESDAGRAFLGERLQDELAERRHTDTLLEALREREEFYRRTLESIPGMTFTTTADGVCDYVSEQWVELTGVPAPEHLGSGWLRLVHPDDRARAAGARRGSVEHQRALDLELRIRRRDGEYEWVKVWCRPLRDASGKIVRWLGTAVNVDGLKRTEAALRASEERLREADRRKDEFLATLAHELRNPLAPLRSGLHVLRRSGGQGPAAERALSVMDRQLGQMVRLIDDLLDLSRISRGKITLRKERIQLAAVVQQAVETSRPMIEQAGHTLSTSVPPEPLDVDGDPTRLAQVLSNLLNNAAKFTEAGGRIEISVRRRGREAMVSVRDSGVGIPPEMLGKVFEMFTQVDASLERSRGGLGIGLSLVKQLVELHGGSVEAHSDGPGKGSVFTVRLPLAPPAAPGEAGPASLHAPAAHRILVVDDNEDAALSLATLLEMTGHATATAHDGLHALEVAEAFRPDVVLLDIGMPRMNGYEAARELRKRPWGRDLLLVALTGWGQEEDRRRSQEAGFDHHLVKPVDLTALEKVLPE